MEWTNRAPTHRYPARFKQIAIQSLIEKEIKRGQAYVNAVLDTETGNMREYRHLINDPKTKQVWNTSAANEFGRLMNRLKRGISGTGTMKLIHKYEVPTGRTVTYAQFVCGLINDPKTKKVWNTLASNEFGRLMNGLKRGISGTGTMKMIHKYEVPTGQTVTYARFVCDYIPQK